MRGVSARVHGKKKKGEIEKNAKFDTKSKKGVDETRMSWYLWRHTAFGAVAERLKAPVC